MFHNISNPKWFGNWSRLEDDYLGNGGTDIADNFTFSKMEKTGGLFGSIIRLATAFPACDPETGHATGAWKVACESIDLDEVPLSDIAFGEGVSLYVNEEGLFTCPPNRAIFATEEMAKAGYLSQLDYSKVVEMGDFYTVLNGDIVAVGFDPETGESHDCTSGRNALAADAPARDAPGKDDQNIG